MPRYNITLSSAQETRPACTVTAWMASPSGAVREAKARLGMARQRQLGGPMYDQWEVWTGNPPYTRHKTVAAGAWGDQQ